MYIHFVIIYISTYLYVLMNKRRSRLCFSSEDELEVLLNGTPEQKKKLIREYLTGESESSSGDEFEKEMEAELSSTIKTLEGTWTPAAAAAAPGTPRCSSVT